MEKNLAERFAGLGVMLPEILLPGKPVEMQKWAVIACDQFTSQKEYWERVKKTVGESPSTLKLILPECYLEDGDIESRVMSINDTMHEYLSTGIFESHGPGFVLVDRSTEYAESRKGIILAVDLECYDFSEGSTTLIRPTEGTIIDRLPPRMNIRRGASLDLPHILFLMDDPEGRVIETAAQHTKEMKKLYDFDLLEGGGHVVGRLIDDPDLLDRILIGLEGLLEKRSLLFAVGDGNHSLAAAKSIWDEVKTGVGVEDLKNHPARYALVEVVNIHGPGLVFEPIHRVLFGVDREDFTGFLGKSGRVVIYSDPPQSAAGKHIVEFSGEGRGGYLEIDDPASSLPAEALQKHLDEYVRANTNVTIDYIHGEESARKLAAQSGNLAFYLPALDKNTFFDSIVERGPYPRKTFSLGEASEKRYYLESRRLV